MNIDDVLRTDDWAEAEAMITDHLFRLHPYGFVTLDPPQPPPGELRENLPRGGLLGRLRRRRNVVRDRPLVQLVCQSQYLDAECSGPVGDAARGYGYPWNEGQQHRLLELGWQPPEELDDWHMYRWYGAVAVDPTDGGVQVPAAVAAEAARLVVSTLRDVYAMRSPADLRIVVDRLPG